jgi:hypothetical protein
MGKRFNYGRNERIFFWRMVGLKENQCCDFRGQYGSKSDSIPT